MIVVRRIGGLAALALMLPAGAAAMGQEVPTSMPAGPAQAPTSQPQDGGADGDASASGRPPTQDVPSPREPALKFDELTFELGFDAEAQRREVMTDQRGPYAMRHRQTDTRWRFEESLGMRTSGSLLGERVMRYDAFVRWGLTQERFRENRPGPDLTDNPDGHVLEYDMRIELFPAGKLSGSLNASQLDDRIGRAFLPSLNRHRERYGAGLHFNDPTLPMSLTWERSFETLRSATRGLADDEDRHDDTLRYEAAWQPTEHHSLRLEYEYDQRREKFSGGSTRFDNTRNYLVLDHVLSFGRDHRSRIETLLRFQDETGDLSRDTYEAAPRLTLQLTDALAAHVRGQILKESYADLDVQSQRGEAGLTHQLSDWLTSTAEVYGLRSDGDANADGTEWGGVAGTYFNRENRFGRLSANLTYTHSAARTNDGRRSGLVPAEAVTFRDPQTIYLSHENIDVATILVTDAARGRVYLYGRDYVAARVGRFTSIQRVRTGRIVDGETVLVSYLYRVADDFELTRDRLDGRIQQDFKFGLSPYYAGSVQHESVDRSDGFGWPGGVGWADGPTWRARAVNRHRVGATFRKPRWSVGLEYEYNDDGIDPYEALHANGDVVLLESARQSLTARATASRFLYDGSAELRSRDTTMIDAGLGYRVLLGRSLEGTANAAYRWEDDTRFGLTRGVDLSAALNYRIGLVTVLFEAEYDYLELPQSSDGTAAFWLKLRREFPVIARRR